MGVPGSSGRATTTAPSRPSPGGSEQWAVVDLELPAGGFALIDMGDDEGEIDLMLSVALPIAS